MSIKDMCHEAMVAYLSGLAPKIGKEIHWEYWEDPNFCVKYTVEFLPNDRCTFRNYYSGSNIKQWETKYKDGKRDGISTGWLIDGQVHYKYKYKDGEFVGEETICISK